MTTACGLAGKSAKPKAARRVSNHFLAFDPFQGGPGLGGQNVVAGALRQGFDHLHGLGRGGAFQHLQGATLLQLDGALGACVVDSNSGMMLGAEGGGPVNLEIAAAGNTEVVRAKRKTMTALKLEDGIEDVLITLGKQYHIIRPLAKKDGLFLYVVLDKVKSNLALARRKVHDVEAAMVV